MSLLGICRYTKKHDGDEDYMENVSIIGCGTMGHSIALSAAWAGLPVKVYGINEKDLGNADKGLRSKLKVMMDNDVFSEQVAKRIRETNRVIYFIRRNDCPIYVYYRSDPRSVGNEKRNVQKNRKYC